MKARVDRLKDGKVRADIVMSVDTLERNDSKEALIRGQHFHLVRVLTPGKTVKIVLAKLDGKPCSWVNLTVTQVGPEDRER